MWWPGCVWIGILPSKLVAWKASLCILWFDGCIETFSRCGSDASQCHSSHEQSVVFPGIQSNIVSAVCGRYEPGGKTYETVPSQWMHCRIFLSLLLWQKKWTCWNRPVPLPSLVPSWIDWMLRWSLIKKQLWHWPQSTKNRKDYLQQEWPISSSMKPPLLYWVSSKCSES